VRIALTNVGPMAVQARAADQGLLGRALDDTSIKAAAAAAMAAANPAADLRGDVDYKTAMAGQMVQRALRAAAARCA
jgi:aerobic carbon-monoxide dehydrogenase medium subunit